MIQNLYLIVTSVILISCSCNLIIGWFPVFLRTWIWALALSFFSILYYSKGLKNKAVVCLLIYGITLFFNCISGDIKFDNIGATVEFVFLFSLTCLLLIYAQYSFHKVRRRLIYVYIIITIITFFCTAPLFLENPDILRQIQKSVINQEGGLYLFYAKIGLISYAMGHALPVFVPVVIFLIKRGKISLGQRIGLWAGLLVLLLLVYMSTATTSLLLMITLVLISFLWDERKRSRNRIMLLICSFILILLFSDNQLLSELLGTINLEGDTYTGKMEEFQNLATGKMGSQTSGRLNLYEQSMATFLSSPIIGSNKMLIGGHSIFLDRLGMLGLVGFVPFAAFLYYFRRITYKKLTPSIRPYFNLSFFYVIILWCLKNMFIYDFLIMVLFMMPIVYITISEEQAVNKSLTIKE